MRVDVRASALCQHLLVIALRHNLPTSTTHHHQINMPFFNPTQDWHGSFAGGIAVLPVVSSVRQQPLPP